MKLIRIGDINHERPAAVDKEGTIRDLSSRIDDFTPDWFASGRLQDLAALDLALLPILEAGHRVGAPLSRVGKIVCIGLNYRDHATETGQAIPGEPIIFLKGGHTVQGPNDLVRLPRNGLKTDWEVELAVVIGRRASYISPEDATKHIAGFCVFNDLSERHFQLERGGQWDKGKNCETFGPLGPWLVTPDEVPDVKRLGLWLDVNGIRRQNGSTASMIFDVPFLIHYVSQFMPLEPGDIISTGTPPGIGMAHNPPCFLKAGDVITLGIEGLGSQRQMVHASE